MLRLVVGAPRGTGADRWARGFAPFLERHWQRSGIALSNQPGEGGLTAARAIAAAPPDGITIGLVAVPSLIARAVERGAIGLINELAFVAAVTEEPVVLVAPPGTDLASLRERGPAGMIGCPPPGSAGQLLAVELAPTLGLTPLAFPNAAAARQAVLAGMQAAGIGAIFHYVPLHASPAGRRYGRCSGELPVTVDLAERILRLPRGVGLGEAQQQRVVDKLAELLAARD